jgi:hypothetical protein
MTMRSLVAALVGTGALFSASFAHAQVPQEFGERGQFIISADRLFSLFAFSDVQSDELNQPVKTTDTYQQSSLSLLLGTTPGIDHFYARPRVGFDYVLVSHLTLGGDVMVYTTLGGSTNTNPPNQPVDNPTIFDFGIAPRIGYIIGLSPLFSFWPRGGVSWYYESVNGPGPNGPGGNPDTSSNQLALDLDPQFVITPVPHVGFTVGLTADIPLTGGHGETRAGTTVSASQSIFFLGGTVGMLAYF